MNINPRQAGEEHIKTAGVPAGGELAPTAGCERRAGQSAEEREERKKICSSERPASSNLRSLLVQQQQLRHLQHLTFTQNPRLCAARTDTLGIKNASLGSSFVLHSRPEGTAADKPRR